MASVRASIDMREMLKDLRAIGDGLDKPIIDTLDTHAAKIADISRGFLHAGAPPWKGSSGAEDFPGGIRAYYDSKQAGTSATVGSTHPAAPVWEWGGTIDPAAGGGIHRVKSELTARAEQRRKISQAGGRKGFHIPRDQPASRAADADMPALERALDDAVDRLIAEHGF